MFLEVFSSFYASKLFQNGFQAVKPRFSGVFELSECFLNDFSRISPKIHHFEGNFSAFLAKKYRFEVFFVIFS